MMLQDTHFVVHTSSPAGIYWNKFSNSDHFHKMDDAVIVCVLPGRAWSRVRLPSHGLSTPLGVPSQLWYWKRWPFRKVQQQLEEKKKRRRRKRSCMPVRRFWFGDLYSPVTLAVLAVASRCCIMDQCLCCLHYECINTTSSCHGVCQNTRASLSA